MFVLYNTVHLNSNNNNNIYVDVYKKMNLLQMRSHLKFAMLVGVRPWCLKVNCFGGIIYRHWKKSLQLV